MTRNRDSKRDDATNDGRPRLVFVDAVPPARPPITSKRRVGALLAELARPENRGKTIELGRFKQASNASAAKTRYTGRYPDLVITTRRQGERVVVYARIGEPIDESTVTMCHRCEVKGGHDPACPYAGVPTTTTTTNEV